MASTRITLGGFKNLQKPLAAIDANPIAGLQTHRGIAATDNSRYSQLTGDDGGVTQRRSQIGDDRRSARKERRPPDIAQRGDQDLSRLEMVAVFQAIQTPYCSFDDAERPGKTRDRIAGVCVICRGRDIRIENVAASLWIGRPLEGIKTDEDDRRGRRRGAGG